jgi:hypothetical protein
MNHNSANDYTAPEDIALLASRIEKVRIDALIELGDGLSPEAAQHFLLALAALEQARCHAKLAHYAYMKER